MKFWEDFAVIPAVVTVIGALVALTGTVTTSEVAVADVTIAGIPLNLTTLFPGVGSKFAPLIVTSAPALPLSGVKPVIVGVATAAGVTAKALGEIAVPPGVVTVIFPLVAAGTVTVSDTAVASDTTAGVPLNVTILFAGNASKFVPLIVTFDPAIPLCGALVIDGAVLPPAVFTTNIVGDVAFPPDVATVILPLIVPAGTITTNDVDVAEATVAERLLENLTELFAAVVSKLAPLIVIADPAYCQAGEKPVIVGAAP